MARCIKVLVAKSGGPEFNSLRPYGMVRKSVRKQLIVSGCPLISVRTHKHQINAIGLIK